MDILRPSEAFSGIPAGSRIVAGNASGTPNTLLHGLALHAADVGDLTLLSGLLLGELGIEQAVRSGVLSVRSWHIHGPVRTLHREGLVDYVPTRLLDLPEIVLADADVALLRVSPPDADGYCSLGPSASYTRLAAETVPFVIAEVTPDFPRTRGDSRIHVSHIDRFTRSEHAPGTLPVRASDGVSRAIAQALEPIIPDDATVQLGIGRVPDAIAEHLASMPADRVPRGLLGLITDASQPLAQRIAASGGIVTALELIGTERLMSWAHDNPTVRMADSQVLHHPVRLAETPRLISVNSAIAVDLRGQAIAESVDGSMVAGIGGSADFAEGAHLSPGGLRVIAMPATTAKGRSTIVTRHHPDDAITAAHHSIDAVITEHGVARLRGASTAERRDALTAIAAPEHRALLREQS